MADTLRDIASRYGLNVEYNPNNNYATVTGNNGNFVSFRSGTNDSNYGLGGLSNGQNTVTDANKFLSYFGQNGYNANNKSREGATSSYLQTTTPTTTPAYPTAPEAYTPDPEPELMDWQTAYSRAQNQVNPQYDTLRSRAEKSYSQQRENIPQLMAARYGMSGLHGGRRATADTNLTQTESQGIGELESQRAQATNSLATSIQNSDFSNAMDIYKEQQNLKAQQAAANYQKYRDQVLDMQNKDNTDYARKYQMLGLDREDARNAVADSQWQQQFGLQQGQADLQKSEYDWAKDPSNPDNVLKAAQTANYLRDANEPYKTSGGRSTIATTSNPFADTNSNQIYGYDVSRLDSTINSLRSANRDDPNRVLTAIKSNANYNDNFRNALAARLKQLTS